VSVLVSGIQNYPFRHFDRKTYSFCTADTAWFCNQEYSRQNRSSEVDFPFWMKHRWAFWPGLGCVRVTSQKNIAFASKIWMTADCVEVCSLSFCPLAKPNNTNCEFAAQRRTLSGQGAELFIKS